MTALSFQAARSRRCATYCLIVCAGLFCSAAFAEPVLVLNTALQLPLNTEDKTGFLDRIVGEALSRLGYKLDTVHLPAERGLKNANAGVDDGEMARVGGLEAIYPNLIPVPEKIIDLEFTVFSRHTLNLDRSWQSLQGLSVSYINGWKILEQMVPTSAEVTTVRDANQLFLLLKKRRADAVIYERWSAMPIIREMGLHQVRRQKPPLTVEGMYIYLHMKHRKLVPRLAETLRQLKKEGMYQALAEKYLVPWERRKQP